MKPIPKHKNGDSGWADISIATQYEISIAGEVRSKDRWADVSNGRSYYLMGRMLSQVVKNNGYLQVCLYIKGVKKYCLVHRLVAKAFIPNIENLPQINHKNCIKTDNRVENLEWISPKGNISHMIINNLRDSPKGENHFMCKISDIDAAKAVGLYKSGKYLMREVAAMFNIHRRTLGDIINGKTRKYLR